MKNLTPALVIIAAIALIAARIATVTRREAARDQVTLQAATPPKFEQITISNNLDAQITITNAIKLGDSANASVIVYLNDGRLMMVDPAGSLTPFNPSQVRTN